MYTRPGGALIGRVESGVFCAVGALRLKGGASLASVRANMGNDACMQATRRQFLLGGVQLLAFGCQPPATPIESAGPAFRTRVAAPSFADLEAQFGGRLGVHVVDTATEHELSHRADERFALCSTFKWLLAAAILQRVERTELTLEQTVAYGPADLVVHAPVTSQHVSQGALSIGVLCEAIVTVSDNPAANLLLKLLGGPEGFTAFVRALGDDVTRLDRIEPTLNSNEPGDPRDTTTPRSMTRLLREVLLGDVLGAENRERLFGWMRASPTGTKRIRAGVPATWVVGDKTGTGGANAVNDVAILVPPGKAPILMAVYATGGNAELHVVENVHAEVARRVVRALG